MRNRFPVKLAPLLLILCLAAGNAAQAGKLPPKAWKALTTRKPPAAKNLKTLSLSAGVAARTVSVASRSISTPPPAVAVPAVPPVRLTEKQLQIQQETSVRHTAIIPPMREPVWKAVRKAQAPLDKHKAVDSILETSENPLVALASLRELQKTAGRRNLFTLLAKKYYRKNFPVLTQHLSQLFEKINSLHDNKVEYRLIKRMRFLADNRAQFREFFAPDIGRSGMRMRFLSDISKLTPQNFNPANLAFSFERRLDPSNPRAQIRHVNARSEFPVKDRTYRVLYYSGTLDYLPNLYRYLINGNHARAQMIVIFDQKERALAIYNQDKKLWLRITPHEYAFPDNLHLHLNDARTARMTTALGVEVEETVNFNLSIPLGTPKNLPSQNVSDYLYEQFVLKPVNHFRNNPHVTIIERSIF